MRRGGGEEGRKGGEIAGDRIEKRTIECLGVFGRVDEKSGD